MYDVAFINSSQLLLFSFFFNSHCADYYCICITFSYSPHYYSCVTSRPYFNCRLLKGRSLVLYLIASVALSYFPLTLLCSVPYALFLFLLCY